MVLYIFYLVVLPCRMPCVLCPYSREFKQNIVSRISTNTLTYNNNNNDCSYMRPNKDIFITLT